MQFAIAHLELPVRLRTAQPMTEQELLRFCAENDLLQIERDANGELIVMSPTGSEGGFIDTNVTIELGLWARVDGKGGAFNSNTGFTLPDGSMRAADAHWVSWERWNALDPVRRKGFAPICPEFVIEVRSESDSLTVLREKMEMWLANGVALAWLIDPSRKVVEIYRPGQAPEAVAGVSAVEGEGPVAGFVLELARIWIE